MKELQNIIHRHFEDPKQKKRYLAIFIALSMLVSFMVPLILMEPADSRTGVLVCGKIQHTHSEECYINGCNLEEHLHTEECYAKVTSLSSTRGSSEEINNVLVPNAGGGYNEDDGTYTSKDAHEDGESGYYNPAMVPLYTLLFGEGGDRDWVDTEKTLDQNLQTASKEYFLGFASDFCAFIESDFTAFDADAEGRIFIGGDLIFEGKGNDNHDEWNYQVGAGDYGNFDPISTTDEYMDVKGFASGIIGGKVYRLATLTTGPIKWIANAPELNGKPDRHTDNYDVYLYPEEGLYKRFIVGNLAESLHYDEDYDTEHGTGKKDVPYEDLCNHVYYDMGHDNYCEICKGLTDEEMKTSTHAHSYLREVNELAQFYLYDDVSTILEKTFDTIRARSANLGAIQATEVQVKDGKLTLDASNIGDAKTAYFKLEDWSPFYSVEIVVPPERILETGVSSYADNNMTITKLDLNIIISCDDQEINLNGIKTYVRPSDEKLDEANHQISNREGNKDYTNNHPLSSNILYNFPNATSVNFGGNCNFNGTILAPNADAISPEKCPGHLSGALIAKSFYGGLEFGYRPYRGGTDVLGMASGYEVPVDKLIADTTTNLAGAMFAIKEGDDVISLFESGNGTNYAALPSKVDFSGKTPYKQEAVVTTPNDDRKYTGNTVAGETLTAPVEWALYSDYECKTSIDPNTSVLGKFYIKTNQKVTLQSINEDGSVNDNIYVPTNNNPSGENVYTVYLNKPVTSFKIKATSQANNSTFEEIPVSFTPMGLNVTASEYKVGTPIKLSVANLPKADNETIYYRYKVNGTVINKDPYNNNSEYTTNPEYEYTPTINGELLCSVEACINRDGSYHTIAEVTAEKKEVNEYTFPEGVAIDISGTTLSFTEKDRYSIASGNNIKIDITNKDLLPTNAVIKYTFYDSEKQAGNEFGTNGIFGFKLPVNVEITAYGLTYNLSDQITVNFKEDDITLNVQPNDYKVGQNASPIEFSLNNFTNNDNVKKNTSITYYYNDVEVNGSSIIPTVVGEEVPVKAIVTVNGLTTEVTKTIKGGYQDVNVNMPNGTCNVNDVLKVETYYLPTDYQLIVKLEDRINTSNDVTSSNNGYNSVEITPSVAGTYNLIVSIKYKDNEEKVIRTQQITVNEVTTTTITTQNQNETTTTVNNDETNTEQTLSFSLRNLSAPTEENLNPDDNLIEIEAPENDRIDKLTLTFPNDVNAKQATFTLEAVFTDSNGNKHTKNFNNKDNVNDQNPYYLEITTSYLNVDIKKIEIKSIEGSIKVENVYPVYVAREDKVSKTSSAGFMLNPNETEIITIEDWVEKLDSVILNLKSGSKISYTIIRNDGSEIVKDVEVTSNDNKISIKDLYCENAKEIRITAKDSQLVVNDYVVSSYVEELPDDPEAIKNNELEIKSVYTIVEQQAPVGYFKDDNVFYTVEVVEKIDLIKLVNPNQFTYPSVVDTTIVAKDKDGNEVFSYNLEISYPVNDNNIDTNTRIIKINDDTFTITKNEDVINVTCDNSSIDTSEWDSETPDQYGDYYFDPIAMMIVPIPQTHLTFTNKMGLLFRKVDDKGAAVTGVNIVLDPDPGVKDNVDVWYWDNNESSEWLVDYTKLDTTTIYKFVETETYGKYELADPICFQKTDNNEITYWNESTPNDKTVLNLEENRIIRMENTRVTGIKLQLKKTDLNGNVIVDENNVAKFSLHANDGTVLLPEIEVNSNTIDLDFSGFTEEDTTYVENGYLKPGTYYLKETKAPSGYEASMKYFYFNVVKDSKGAYSVTPVEKEPGISVQNEKKGKDDYEVIRFAKEALDRISEEMITDDDIVLQFTLYTSNSKEVTEGWGNYAFFGVFDGQVLNSAAEKKTIDKNCATITYKLTAKNMLEVLGITPETDSNNLITQFRNLTSFEIGTISANNTRLKDYDFIDISKDKAENISNISFTEIYSEHDLSKCVIEKLVFHYADGNSVTQEKVKIEKGSNNCYNLDLSQFNKENVAAIEIKVKGANNKKLVIETTDGRKIWGNIVNSSAFENKGIENFSNTHTVIGGEEFSYTFGVIPTVDTEQTPDNSTQSTPNTNTIPTLSVDKTVVIISNDRLGNTMKLRVVKNWEDDEEVMDFRKSVEVKLYQSTSATEKGTLFAATEKLPNTVTLNSDNEWNYVWEELPRFVNGLDDTAGKFYYTVEETSTILGYTSEPITESLNESGTIVITNKLDKVNIPVTKTWDYNGHANVKLPTSIKFKLLAKIDGNWKPLNGKTLELTGEGNTWSGVFENLPKGYEYQVVEENVPFGWATSYERQNITSEETKASSIVGFNVKNTYTVDTGSIAVQKLWQGISQNTALPYAIKVDLYRSVIAPSYTETDAPYTDNDSGPIGTPSNGDAKYMEDYARLLQHSLYFYDANMCGTDVAENSALAWRTNCHTEDGVTGGYHDAGDHVMFGLPQGYTASMLGWSYLEFFKDNTTRTMDPDEAAHYKVILERFYEFFEDSVHYDSTGNIYEILVQKGDGNGDHLEWGSPEKQSTDTRKMEWSSQYGSNIAAQYAAALALGYLNFRDTNPAKYDEYLELAKKLYDFAGRTGAYSAGSFYADGDDGDDKSWAAAWLYEAVRAQTNPDNMTDAQKAEMNGYLSACSNSPNQLQWDDVSFAAACAYARQTGDWTNVINKIETEFINNSDSNKKEFYYIHPWGTARFNAMAQTAALITAKNLEKTPDKEHTYSSNPNNPIKYSVLAKSYVTWAEGQMDKILGKNEWKYSITGLCKDGVLLDLNEAICLVTNFVPKGYTVDTPQAPHHRAASGWEDIEEYKANCGYDEDGYTLIGALVGGPAFKAHTDQDQMKGYNHKHPLSYHDYIDDLHDYCCNEVAIDYNAGLVGAAAGLYYFTGKGLPSTKIEGVEYGAYGLRSVADPETGDITSPTKGSVSESVQPTPTSNEAEETKTSAFSVRGTLNTAINSILSRSFGVGRNTVKATEGSSNNNYYTISGHIFNDSECNKGDYGYSITGNFENVTSIQVDFASYAGNYGMQMSVYSGNTRTDETGWMQTNGEKKPQDILSDFKLKASTTITELRFHNIQPWNGSGVGFTEIRLYYEAGTVITISPNSSDIKVGDIITLTPSGNESNPNWTAEPDGIVKLTPNDDGTCTVEGLVDGTVNVKAEQGEKKGTATINVHEMGITGADSVGLENNIILDKQYSPDNATEFVWSSSDPTKATVDQTGKVVGIAPGSVTITLEAKDVDGNILDTAEKVITVKNVRTLTIHNQGPESDGGGKYFYSLSNLPAGAILKSVTIHVTPTSGQDTEYEGALMLGKENSPPEPWEQMDIRGTFSGSGQTITIDNTKPSNNGDNINMDIIDCSKHDFCFGLWSKSCTVNIDWVTFEYEMDSTYIEIQYADGTDAKTIRKNVPIRFKVTPTGGRIGSVQLMKDGEVVKDLAAELGIDLANGGTYEYNPQVSGDYTIVAAMAGNYSDRTDSINLTVKDDISINGNSMMDLGTSQTLTVNNKIEDITWNVTVGEGYTLEGDTVVTIKKENTLIATFDKSTGEVVVSTNGGEFTITAADSYDNGNTQKVSSMTISITERPKLPELPKDVFLEPVILNEQIILTEEKGWTLTVEGLEMTDEKGNPYYYYIQENGYKLYETDEGFNPMSENYIHSSNAVFMPVNYYNNGILPSKNGNINTAKVENKLTETIQGQMPSSGGVGRKTYYFFGGMIMLLSAAGYTCTRRRQSSRRAK